MRRPYAAIGLVLLLAGASVARVGAYSVLTHEAAVDSVWDSAIRPLLLKRFPRTTRDALLEARSYAYGGSVIQDLGYYPFGNHFFSNLLHYVRAGDFVEQLVRDAGDVNDLAFALGALAHYTTDNVGHPEAVNRAVPLSYPKLQRKFGSAVTYAQAPKEHVIVEFSFDVVQAAGGAYLPEAYRQYIGFRVAKPLLERAFRETYDLEMCDVFADEDRAVSTYRYSVSQLIPSITKAAWRDKQEDIQKLTSGMRQQDFVFVYGRRQYEAEYRNTYQRPGLFARFVGFLYRLLPKIGPLRPLSFKAPSAEVEHLFASSFRDSSAELRAALRNIGEGRVNLADTNFDTGRRARHGDYRLADDTYAELVDRLSHADTGPSRALKDDIRAFYGADPQPSAANRHDRRHWKRIYRQLLALLT